MDSRMNRAEFLKGSLAMGALLAAGDGLVQETLAQQAPRAVEVDKLTLWVLTDNYYDSNRPDGKNIKRYRSMIGRSIHAEHGISFYAETVASGKTSSFMFDFGLDPAGVANNIALLGVDVGKANAFCLSHGHFDHFSGAVALLGQNRSRIADGTPFFVGEEAFARRYKVRPGAVNPTDLGQFRKEELEALKLNVVEVKSSREIVPGA